MSTLLSILIPSTPDRAMMHSRLITELEGQIILLGLRSQVEILLYLDDYEFTIGAKRNWLLDKAEGEYLAFVDSDDRVSFDYLQEQMGVVWSGMDVGSLAGHYIPKGGRQQTFVHSMRHKGWYEFDGILYRSPNHLNAIKSSIAKQIRFPETSFGEDKDYSQRLQESGLIKTEHDTRGVIYYYDYIPNKKNGNTR